MIAYEQTTMGDTLLIGPLAGGVTATSSDELAARGQALMAMNAPGSAAWQQGMSLMQQAATLKTQEAAHAAGDVAHDAGAAAFLESYNRAKRNMANTPMTVARAVVKPASDMTMYYAAGGVALLAAIGAFVFLRK